MSDVSQKDFIKRLIDNSKVGAFPKLASKILEVIDNDSLSIYDLGKIISYDSYISMVIVRVANSAFYGVKRHISDLLHAITVVGLNEVKRIALGISTKSLFDDYSEEDKLLWEHMLAVAIISQVLSYKFQLFNENTSYLAGLLHDIGKIVMHKSKLLNYNLIFKKIIDSDDLMAFDSEIEVYGFTHCDIAEVLLRIWNFDSTVINAIVSHHNKIFTCNSDANRLAAILNFADYAANWLSFGRNKPYKKTPLTDLQSYKALGLQINDIDLFLKDVVRRIEFAKFAILGS